ncbi:exported hypothetical protein [uncultured Alphaproteobacteria bacterium]|uniref:Uncharacterized protein n=1 Tax=uncultured Alphaproteobacteria bacterium TaxID=91750 RepID=A0A212KMH5_9PROT|nr:exported hypothetical protein [uncultured Alphaproteobacteria bacterium]
MRLVSLALAAALGLAPAAEAAFDTWRFPGAPLPLRLSGVDFERADRRDAVVEAIRAMAAAQLRESGLFRADAAKGLTVDLRDVESTASAQTDGVGVGRAAILYRVTDDAGRVVFNDRIVATARVTVADAVELRQSTVRAARYRAFVRNLEVFALRLYRTLSPAPDAPLSLAEVRLAQPLETPERTADYARRIRAALDAQIPTGDAAPPFDLAVESLTFAALPAPGPEQAAAEVSLGIALARPGGAPVWRGRATARAAAARDRALGSGLSPLDTAIADATQVALRDLAPEIAAAATETAAMAETVGDRRLPFRLDRLEAAPGLDDHGLLARLRRWNLEGQPLASVWNAEGAPLAVRIDAAEVRLRKTAPGEGVAEVTVAWVATDAEGRTVLDLRTATTTPFSAADARLRGRDAGDWAVRVGLRDAWIALLDGLAALPAR